LDCATYDASLSGYCDIAVGPGHLFGIRLPQNFNSPYKAVDPSDFWRRWHISLSTCLRDYLYIPLRGSRGSSSQTYRNLMITMLLGGLWHSANWTFLIWGFYHGLLLSIHRAWGGAWDGLPRGIRNLGMMVLVVVGWVFFRSASFTMARSILAKMFLPSRGYGPISTWNVSLAVAVAAAAAIAHSLPNSFELKHKWGPAVSLGLAALFVVCIASTDPRRPPASVLVLGSSFIYGSGSSDEQTLSARLEALSGCITYNASGNDRSADSVRKLARNRGMDHGLVIVECLERHIGQPLVRSAGQRRLALLPYRKELIDIYMMKRSRLSVSPFQLLLQRTYNSFQNDVVLPNIHKDILDHYRSPLAPTQWAATHTSRDEHSPLTCISRTETGILTSPKNGSRGRSAHPKIRLRSPCCMVPSRSGPRGRLLVRMGTTSRPTGWVAR
jgi:MBOAT, membrane-bound O-acyltransferase family